MNETEKKMIDVLYREGYSLNEIRAFRQNKELRDEIAMNASQTDVSYFQDVMNRSGYIAAKYAYADAMLAARIAE